MIMQTQFKHFCVLAENNILTVTMETG